MDEKYLQIFEDSDWTQTARVGVNGQYFNSINIKQEVRQECVLSPLFFNIYAEKI